jgi:hypothetical protein
MPLEFCFKAIDDTEEIEHEILDADEPGLLIADYWANERKVIGIECNPNDDGGVVIIMEREGVLVGDDIEVDEMDFPPPVAVIHIPEGGVHEQEFADELGTEGTIIIRHVPDDVITRNFVIPRGLRYPN